LESVVSKSFESLKKRLIFQEVRKHLKACLNEHRTKVQETIKLLYRDETARMFTFNLEAFSRYRAEEEASLTHFRHWMRLQPHGPVNWKYVPWEQLNEEKRAQALKRREMELSKIGRDPFEEEIGIIAYVRGYYRLAGLRFADAVSQCIILRLIPGIRRELASYIDEKLGLRVTDPSGVYQRLMEEDEATASRRVTLKAEKEKFVKALASIEALETGVNDGTSRRDDEISDHTVEDLDMYEV
jgi:hypothetical protein